MNIIVTTPVNESINAKLEAEKVKQEGGGLYFRRFSTLPKHLNVGDKVFYTEAGYIRGYALVCNIVDKLAVGKCSTTGRDYPKGYYVFMDASTWKWVKPVPYKGFQGFRYFDQDVEVVGGWEDDMPNL